MPVNSAPAFCRVNLSAYLETIKLDGRVFVENTVDALGRNSHVQEYDAGSFAKGKPRSLSIPRQ